MKPAKRELRIIILLIVLSLLVFSWWITELRIENLEAKHAWSPDSNGTVVVESTIEIGADNVRIEGLEFITKEEADRRRAKEFVHEQEVEISNELKVRIKELGLEQEAEALLRSGFLSLDPNAPGVLCEFVGIIE
ncbi:hypothetical protein LCGC14_0345930 [marine sediment metagenome]|uniref:Uncharacterized protein n=1 Tax=marine sediment metagenome TaxID=412755 RepID=A0A0F9VZK5_9ZZZZ